MADGPYGARRPHPVADVPPPALADGVAVAGAWLVRLVAATPLQDVAALPMAALARDAPGLCAALLRAVGSDAALTELEGAGVAARAGRLAGATAPAAVAAAVALLRDAAWAQLRGALAPADAESALGVAVAVRLAHVCDAVLQAALAAAPPEPAGEIVALRGATRAAAEPWAAAVADRLSRHAVDGEPFAVLAVEVDDADRLLAGDGASGEVAGALDAAEAAIRVAAAPGDVVIREAPGRLWLIGGAGAPAAVRALGERVADAVASVVLRAAPLTVSIGVARCPDDATDAQALLARADEGVFGARAAGVPLL